MLMLKTVVRLSQSPHWNAGLSEIIWSESGAHILA